MKRFETYRSAFKSAPREQSYPQQNPFFVPPELLGSLTDMADINVQGLDLQPASAWEIAIRYHEFKSKRSAPGQSQDAHRHLRRLSASAILARAQEVLGSVVHPVEQRIAPWSELPPQAEQVDLDLEETLENSPLGVMGLLDNRNDFPLTGEDVWMSYNVHHPQSIVLSVDTSLSMTGEKLALTAVALAVVLLEFPDDPIGIIAFENEAKILKRLDERISIQSLVERFLDVPAQGYTHLEDGMKAALKLVNQAKAAGKRKHPSTVLLTDGKYTAGKDPAYLAPLFPHLVVLKMGQERASLDLCRELAKKGRGVLREVGELKGLPSIMYGVVKDLLRGRSLT